MQNNFKKPSDNPFLPVLTYMPLKDLLNMRLLNRQFCEDTKQELASRSQKEKHRIFKGILAWFYENEQGLYALGYDNGYHNNLGRSPKSRANVFQPVQGLPVGASVQQIFVQRFYTIVLLDNGLIYGCGDNQYGQLGLKNLESPVTAFTKIPLNEPVKDVALSENCMFIITKSHNLYSCGKNHGQLCLNNLEDAKSLSLIDLPFGIKVKQVIPSTDSLFIIDEDGKMYSGKTISNRPDFISSLPAFENVKEVVAAHSRIFVITDAGNLYGYGDNDHGCLGIGKNERRETTFTQVQGLPLDTKVKQVCIDSSQTVLVTENGAAYRCGNELHDFYASSKVFTPLEGLPQGKKVLKIISINFHSAIIQMEDGFYACGINALGKHCETFSVFTKIKGLPSAAVIVGLKIDRQIVRAIIVTDQGVYVRGLEDSKKPAIDEGFKRLTLLPEYVKVQQALFWATGFVLLDKSGVCYFYDLEKKQFSRYGFISAARFHNVINTELSIFKTCPKSLPQQTVTATMAPKRSEDPSETTALLPDDGDEVPKPRCCILQ